MSKSDEENKLSASSRDKNDESINDKESAVNQGDDISGSGNLDKIRDILLPKLISGKVDVSELDIDFGEVAT